MNSNEILEYDSRFRGNLSAYTIYTEGASKLYIAGQVIDHEINGYSGTGYASQFINLIYKEIINDN